jgi:hypothetical protein
MEYSSDELREIRQRGRARARLYLATSAFMPVGVAVGSYGLLAANTDVTRALSLAGAAILLAVPGVPVSIAAGMVPAALLSMQRPTSLRWAVQLHAPADQGSRCSPRPLSVNVRHQFHRRGKEVHQQQWSLAK